MRQPFHVITLPIFALGYAALGTDSDTERFQINHLKWAFDRSNFMDGFLAERDEHVDSVKHGMHAHT
ncbi:hypothetical protein D3C81_2227060 [compost metagenome]